MPAKIKPSCVICAWRATCNKQFSVTDPSHCPEFTLDVTVKDFPGRKGIKVLVEGRPGVGKTTLIERLVTKLGKDVSVGGFYTREIRVKGERRGFRIISFDKREGVLAHEDLKGGLKVGRYVVNLEDLESIGVASIESAISEDDVIVIDEIGKMELFSNRFREMVEIALDSEKPLVATIASEGPPFVDEIKGRKGVHLFTLTAANRDETLEELVKHLREEIA